jgi:hypothetical protein
MSDLAVFGTVTPGQKRGLVAGRKRVVGQLCVDNRFSDA